MLAVRDSASRSSGRPRCMRKFPLRRCCWRHRKRTMLAILVRINRLVNGRWTTALGSNLAKLTRISTACTRRPYSHSPTTCCAIQSPAGKSVFRVPRREWRSVRVPGPCGDNLGQRARPRHLRGFSWLTFSPAEIFSFICVGLRLWMVTRALVSEFKIGLSEERPEAETQAVDQYTHVSDSLRGAVERRQAKFQFWEYEANRFAICPPLAGKEK